MSTVMTLVCVLLSLGWGGTGMAQDRPPEIVMDSSAVEGSAASDTGQVNRADAERGQAGLTSLLGHLKMVSIPGGSFMMGCTARRECDDDNPEYSEHEVQVNDFEIGQYEVTQEVWEAVMGENPSRFSDCAQCPVENVSWEDVQRFLDELNARTGGGYRLPTEAEWEYAARGGQQSRVSQYAGSDDPGAVGWYEANSGKKTHPVGQKEPNELGVYDMNGNVWELVENCGHCTDTGAPSDGLAWESGNCSERVLRGGSWNLSPEYFLSELRVRNTTWLRDPSLGFRVARTHSFSP